MPHGREVAGECTEVFQSRMKALGLHFHARIAEGDTLLPLAA